MHRSQKFQFVFYGILALFTGLMIYVTYVAFTRLSGSTGLDMARIQKVRYDSLQDKQTSINDPVFLHHEQ
ncbi:hypothetical protein [Candidatus Protochlamydia amoebophila]|uniref:Uncharacterized protein n=1 Tax=Candidatus Protochlamydia amoebophila TaxID=362787 RepID=A0A0C1HAI9_9BACT|nr:hypothetical protein [Candidatus Protochlamydia amoebophila]KIC74394.1 hypothetical protein DB44_AL00880 [Candidatus Protochlamydia amoebophila]